MLKKAAGIVQGEDGELRFGEWNYPAGQHCSNWRCVQLFTSSRRTAIDLGYKYHHISNANLGNQESWIGLAYVVRRVVVISVERLRLKRLNSPISLPASRGVSPGRH